MADETTSTDEGFNERRIFPRFYPTNTLRVDLNSLGVDETFSNLDCLDVSETGMKVKCRASRKLPFIDSSLIEVRMELPEETENISFLAKLQRTQKKSDDRLLALRIVQIGVRDKEVLRHMIYSHVGKTSPT